MMAELGFFFVVILLIFANYCAYRNGVNDGAGAVFEPWNPGYYTARQWLKKNNMKMWNLDVFKGGGDD